MISFDHSVLVLAQLVCSSWMHRATGFGEEVLDFWVVEQFTPLIHVDMFAITLWIALHKEMLQQ